MVKPPNHNQTNKNIQKLPKPKPKLPPLHSPTLVPSSPEKPRVYEPSGEDALQLRGPSRRRESSDAEG